MLDRAFEYIPRKPEETVLYGVIVEQLETFLARQQARERPVPRFVEKCGAPHFIHLIVLPETESALSNALRDTHAAYAAAFNRKYGFTGHLWQARFYSCVLDDDHLRHAVRYVERNPVRARMVLRAEDYPWSSARPHVLGQPDRYLDDGLPLIGSLENWSAWLAIRDAEEPIRAIREATATGRACGSDDFVRRLESQCGRSLRPQKRGRKPGSHNTPQTGEGVLPIGW